MPKKSHNAKKRLLVALVLLGVLLAGCSPASTRQNGTPPMTSLALSPTTTEPSTPTIPTASTDWTTYHLNTNRTGYVANTPDPTRLTRTWTKQLDGAVYAEPLVVGRHVLVATENNSLYAFDSRTGDQLWHTRVGTPVPLSTLPCGNIDPLGITGTPVYDPATNLVFAVAEITGPAHILVGLDVATGALKVRRSADISGMDPTPHQQRAALALSHGMIYIAYGGLEGDCGNYRGTVVAARTDGQGDLLSYLVPTPREGGIWAPPGPAIDSQGKLYVAVGNGAQTSGDWDHSDSILRLSPALQLEDGFAPTSWANENANDADLGSMGPILLPGGWIYTNGKGGQGYVLKASKLGGVGGQVAVSSTCTAFGGSAAIDLQVFIPCTSGLQAITISPEGQITKGWQGPSEVQGSPIAGGKTIYALDIHGTLYAFDSASGAIRTSVPLGATSRFATPTLSGNTLFVGTYTGVVAVVIE